MASLMDRHLDAAALVRLLDGEAAAAEHESAAAHLAGCRRCSARFGALRRRSARLTQVLAAADWPCPPMPVPHAGGAPRVRATRALRPGWRIRRAPAAAAAAILLGVAAVVASPLPGWIGAWTAAGWSRLVGATDKGTAPEAPSRTRVRFEPVGVELSLDFAAYQQTGAITVRALDVPYVEVTDDDGAATLLVLPAGIRILNDVGSTAEYQVTVPARIQRVRIRIAGRDAVILDADRLARGARIPLGAAESAPPGQGG
ncbi:MAG TPA: hypothetical protein VF188_13555 [Longimicrobiales bacterium]